MMDRLRLRFWDKEECQYLKPSFFDSIWFDKDGGIHVGCYSDIIGKVVDYTNEVDIEQCTGLKDKNGKLIFEGDVVKSMIRTGYIKWHKGDMTWYVYVLKSNEIIALNGYLDGELEIIGNIHEQAEQKREQ